MLPNLKILFKRILLIINRAKFRLFFRRRPRAGDYCNSKLISVLVTPSSSATTRRYLAYVRSGSRLELIDDGGERNFDIALNLYADNTAAMARSYEYLIAGGVNKYKAAYQFIDRDLLDTYKAFIFLDDDLETTYSDLSGFLRYCDEHDLKLAQPSLTQDSYYSHLHLVNASNRGWRHVDMIEVMCPCFSAEALKSAIRTFDLSYSTWGLDYIWPKLLGIRPAVVDEFTIRHTRPVNASSAFYQYMREIGVSPERESKKLKNISMERLWPKGVDADE